jgi:hypothetical protein
MRLCRIPPPFFVNHVALVRPLLSEGTHIQNTKVFGNERIASFIIQTTSRQR